MKKKLSGFGILFMLLVKNPPLPQFSLFTKETITQVRSFSMKKIAMEFNLN